MLLCHKSLTKGAKRGNSFSSHRQRVSVDHSGEATMASWLPEPLAEAPHNKEGGEGNEGER